MKYFFFEKFLSPCSYTMVVAVNSMVGHILGLVDRHTNNIPTRRQRVPSLLFSPKKKRIRPRPDLNRMTPRRGRGSR